MYTYKYTNHLYFCLLFYRTNLCQCADFLGCFTGLTCTIVLISWVVLQDLPVPLCWFPGLFYRTYLCHCADFLGCFTGLTCAIVLISWGRPRRSPPRACLTCWRGTRTATPSSTPPCLDPPSPCTTRPCSPSSSPVSRAYSPGNSARIGRWGGCSVRGACQ